MVLYIIKIKHQVLQLFMHVLNARLIMYLFSILQMINTRLIFMTKETLQQIIKIDNTL